MTGSQLTAQDISVRYGSAKAGTTALKSVSLTLNPNQITCFFGRSGSGKSTLLRALLGQTQIFSGDVALGDQPISLAHDNFFNDFSSSRRQLRNRVSWVAQEMDLCGHVSVLDNVCHGRLQQTGTIRSIINGFDKSTVDEAYNLLCQLDLGNKIHEPARNLSGGQKQRVAIARALFQFSDWILADEPFSALDVESRELTLKVLLEAHTAGRGLILVLHDLDLSHQIADRLVGLKKGKIVLDGAPSDISLATLKELARDPAIQ